MEASEANLTPAETTAPDTSAPAPEGAGVPDVSEQLAALNTRFESLAERIAPAEEPAPAVSEQDLIAALTEEDGEYEEDGYGQDAYGEQQQPGQDETAELDAYVRERVAAMMNPLQEQIEQRFRAGDLAALAEKYPSLRERETLGAVRARLEPLAARYGEGILTDPATVEQALLAYQAANAAASETPATEARGQGAHIETGTGAAGDPGESPEESIVNSILRAGGGKSAFAG